MKALDLRARVRQVHSRLEQEFVHSSHEWVDLILSANGAVTLTVVSNQFDGIATRQRENQVRQLWRELTDDAMGLIWMTLVTVAEAESLMLTRGTTESSVVSSWLDFAHATLNERSLAAIDNEHRHARVVVFYSYKGGVGRTTAMLHVAALLTQRGKRIVMVDMDLEAPGLRHAVEKLEPDPKHGLVDYLYERQLLMPDMQPTIHIQDIVGRVHSNHLEDGELFVVPAGHVDLEYIAVLDDLDSQLGSSGPQGWTTFLAELTEEVKPDLIFIDSRTGLNRWGAISLLMMADEAFVFAYPNRQNLEGMTPLLQALTGFGRPPLTVVFSAVPRTDAGQALIERAWQQIAPLLPLPADRHSQGDPERLGRPVVVYYDPNVATAPFLPLENTEPYLPLAARIGDIAEEVRHIEYLANVTAKQATDWSKRWRLIESLTMPTPFAERDFDPALFQPIQALDKILDPGISIIRGRKGTGKSYLFRMLQTRNIREIAPDRLEGVWILPAHGQGVPGPDTSAFRTVNQRVGKHDTGGWENFWFGYALVRLWIDTVSGNRQYGPQLPTSSSFFEPYRRILAELPHQTEHRASRTWTKVHTDVALKLATTFDKGSYNKLLLEIQDEERKSRRRRKSSIWLIYDNLEFDLPDVTNYWSTALEGLCRFIYRLDDLQITWLRVKLFLREDLWQQLQFVNKSHFHDRQAELQWEKLDLARLAYRLLSQSGAVTEFIRQFYDIPDPERADEETLVAALGLIWGLRRSQSGNAPRVYDWLYERMTDASNTTYPREMIHLLSRSFEAELEMRNEAVPPKDRLLREEALNAGLAFASVKRCEALRTDEYKSLASFMDSLRGAPVDGEVAGLHHTWLSTGQSIETQFQSFVALLESIGLLSLSEDRLRYRFADLYIDGLGLVRQPGQVI